MNRRKDENPKKNPRFPRISKNRLNTCLVIIMPYADERISIKKEKFPSYLVYNIVSLGKMTGKAEPFS